ncbi:FecR family protein [Longitalea luteola]|uniref:FecR family protein n=1 Tax=Longitalea luteola TaxID=2812563 RepID=UPI001A96B728|nr:FecR family protein [Longitalea luteola]
MDQQSFEDFLKKVAQQTHSPSELAEFLRWLKSLPGEQAAAALDKYEQVFSTRDTNAGVDSEALRRIEEGIENRLGPWPAVDTISQKRTPVVLYLKVAAIFVVVLSIVSFFLYQNQFAGKRKQPVPATAAIGPGKNQAVLKLSGGRSILLEEVADGVITMNDKATGFEKKSGLLVAKGDGQTPDDAGAINMLETPKGGQYQLALPDGSRVWVNASTRLFFPTVFKPGERKVKVLGEAYFEVKSDPKNPFIVETGTGAFLRVLGTSFNVSAYPEDAQEITTLLTGSLQVTRSQSQVLLKPGQQAIVNPEKIMDVQEVETSYAVAWKEGYFMFNREPVKDVMNKIARWYDVEVVYEGPVIETRFWGTVSRFSRVSDVLKMLEATGRVHFTIEGRKIIVRKTLKA